MYTKIKLMTVSFLIQAGHVCWDDHDILHGKPTGAIRVSFGYMSTFEDVMVYFHRSEEFPCLWSFVLTENYNSSWSYYYLATNFCS